MESEAQWPLMSRNSGAEGDGVGAGLAVGTAEGLEDADGAGVADVRCHAQAPTILETDWVRVSSLYDELSQIAPSPIIELNRAVAVSMAHGPEIGLQLVDGLLSEPSLKNYHLLPSVRGDLLMKLGRFDDAQSEFTRAAALAGNVRERAFLLKRAAGCAEGRNN
ncbi:hypothetical protein BN871_JQ_00020 [Paenibacillus sp. P22]|nr:hypothetical protein BN871_JQ_00020 [Paenibacillus sp. P22]